VQACAVQVSPGGHAVLQPVQFDGSALKHMPPHMGPLQAHVPPAHVSPAGHALPHEPQFIGSTFLSTQTPLHVVCGSVHLHVPWLQLPTPQLVPHVPQWAGVVWRSVSHPLLGSWSQSP
jgi:hypothetical protein